MQFMKKFWERIGKLNGLILILYTIFVFVSHAFVVYSYDNRTFQFVGRAFFSIGILAVIVCPLIIDKSRQIKIHYEPSLTEKSSRKRFKGLFFIVLFFFLTAYLVHYPGGFGTDSFAQYQQALTHTYNDWHPYFHTLFAFTLPLMLTGGWVGSIVLFQILLLSAVITYTVVTVAEYSNRKYAIGTLLYILLNPSTVSFAMYPLKDTTFSIGALLLMTYALRIHFTNGEWIKKKRNIAMMVVVLSATTLFRHNAILFTIPFLIAVMLSVSRARRVLVAVCTIVLILLFKFPVFHLLEVEKPGYRNTETLGLPMNIIASVVAYNPEALNEETKEFAYRIASQETWESCYTYGNYNHFKYDEGVDKEPIEEYSAVAIVKMALNCVAASPKEALAGAIRTTDPIYTLTDDYNGVMDVEIEANEYGISSRGSSMLRKVYQAYSNMVSIMFGYAVHYVGMVMLILLIMVLARCNLSDWKDWAKICYIIPIFAYNFGTMLLMTHRGDALRFFHYSFFLVPLYLILFCREEGQRD